MIFPMDDLPLFDDEFDFDDEEDFYIVPVGQPAEDFVPEARYTLFQNVNLMEQRIIGTADSVAELLDIIWWSHVRSMFDDFDDWRYGYTVVVYDDTVDFRLDISLEYLIDCVYRVAYMLDDSVMMETIESYWQVDTISIENFWNSDVLEEAEVMLMLTDMLSLNSAPETGRLNYISLYISMGLNEKCEIIKEEQDIKALIAPLAEELEGIGLTPDQINGVVTFEGEVWVHVFRADLVRHSYTYYIRIK